jgi:hypothetical protein
MVLPIAETLARRNSTCPLCKRRIAKGHPIQKCGDIGWVHSFCARRNMRKAEA